jgi:Zn-dependent peptidase ImmA (M78 family)
MRVHELNESPVKELASKLPSLSKHDYNTIDQLMQRIAKKHKITGKALHDLFIRKYKKTPDDWIKDKLDENNSGELDIKKEVDKFVDWAKDILNIKNDILVILSKDTEEAQTNHHTGSHRDGENKIWVYAKNRNLVDILRTVFHELVHVRQGQLNMIKPGSSYPGSPIEAEADVLAGKFIKIYGEKNHHIFQ